MKRIGLALLILCVCFVPSAWGQKRKCPASVDWTQFFTIDMRRWNPCETVLNAKNVKNLGVKWTYTTGGSVSSPPVVVDGVVYVGSSDGSVYALYASTGALQWSYATGGGITYSSAAVANGVVYVGSTDGNVYALDAKTGAKQWSYTTGGPVSYSSPAVANGVLYVAGGGNMYALNARTGGLLWIFNLGYPRGSSIGVANGVVYVGRAAEALFALDAGTGVELWYFLTGDGDCLESSPAVADGVVYFATCHVFAINARTGDMLRMYGAVDYMASSPAVANGVVYVVSEGGDVYALSTSTGAPLWITNASAGGWPAASPAVANGVVYLGGTALKAASGDLLWTSDVGSAMTSPAVANGVVYVGADDGNVYAFGLQ
jgi:outer membrane protein assembly factor BamB